MIKRKKILVLIVVFALALAACAGSAVNADANTVIVDANPVNNDVANANDAGNDEDMAADEDADNDADNDGGEAAEDSASSQFEINAAESEVRFSIWEVLMGSDKLVIGATNAVQGSINVDIANPGAVSMSVIEVDLTGIATDNKNRNGQVHKKILETSTFPATTFEAVEYIGLPDSVAVGDTFDFQIIGNLTIKDVTKSVTFDVTLTVVSESRIEGLASLDIAQADYGVNILRLPSQVASVKDTTLLEIEFVADN